MRSDGRVSIRCPDRIRPGDAEVRGQGSWGQGERGAGGYEDHGSSELTFEGGQVLGGYSEEEQQRREGGGHMKLTSPAFSHGSSIPSQFTCDGKDISPALSWTNAPKKTKSFVLIVHDPDAPRKGGFTHWIVYNIAANVNRIAENVSRNASIPGMGLQGKNDSGRIGYMGPCPPPVHTAISLASMPCARNSHSNQARLIRRSLRRCEARSLKRPS
jgi:Raf kinase inhibitor-like YbhB/YbcL family protein